MIGLNEELRALEAQGKKVRIGMIGAGQMGTDVVAEVKMMPGVDVVITADVDIERAMNAYKIGLTDGEVAFVKSAAEADAAIEAGKYVAVNDYRILVSVRNIDVVLEATGVPEIGARAALRTVRNGHDLAMMNVESDITVGPILH